MRPAGRAETDSLYFNYPYFDAPADRSGLTDPAPVVIVGAGPIGMTAALGLAREGVPSVMFDAKSTFNDGSRATCVARSSFHIFERIGAVAPFLEKSLGWTTGRSSYRGTQILEFQMQDGPHEKFRPMYNLQQQYTEQFLWNAVEAEPLIETRWQSKVIALTDTADGALVGISDPAGEYEVAAKWVLAADGARSAMRTLRGLRLKGDNYEGRYVIADIQMPDDYPTIRRALFDPDCRRGATILIHKQPDNIWRIDYQLSADADEAVELDEGTVRASVAAVLVEIGYEGDWELEWWSTYSANTLALQDYRDGPVFFIGDSAHIVPIFGVRGLNNGLADAHNIAWKLGWVLQGKAGLGLLDSYTPERRGATLDVFANASKSARFMTPPSRGWQVMRDAALNLALTHPFAGELANPRQMTPFTYADSPVVSLDDPAFDGGPVAGSILPNARVGDGYLSDLMGAGFSAVVFDGAVAAGLDLAGVEVVVLDFESDAAVALAAGPQSVYLVRPDMHIAGRWFAPDPADVAAGLERAITGVSV
jgi:3-(3-hydroxy-phenyl)propionate hydroxylase